MAYIDSLWRSLIGIKPNEEEALMLDALYSAFLCNFQIYIRVLSLLVGSYSKRLFYTQGRNSHCKKGTNFMLVLLNLICHSNWQ